MATAALKVAVIGGGSSYTPELVEGLIRHHHEFPIQELYLVDIEEGRQKLELVGALARRMVEKAAVPIRVHLTLNRQEAIHDADFVITQIRVGRLPARVRDERIPLGFDCLGQETTGAGGFAKALRTVPVILDIAQDIQNLAPNAWMINFTNPTGIITEAVLKYGGVKNIGLCNLAIGTRMQIAEMAGVDRALVDFEWVGINHLNWARKIRVGDTDIMPLVWSMLNNAASVKNIPALDWNPVLLKSLGAIPCSYLRYYYMTDEMLRDEKQQARTEGTRGEVVQRIEQELFELYQNPQLAEKPKQLEQRGGAYYSLAAVELIASIYSDRRDVQTVNVRNGHILPFLPADASIEVNAVIDATGAHPIQLELPVPTSMRGLLQVVKAYEELTIEAAVRGDYGLALEALTLHPLVTSGDTAREMLDQILEQNRSLLPRFFA
ncbi:6-phospho-beta-glucosidase [Sulfobacillus harzensis]|uniref:6-phospho-beta-glucosidase n=1 Tax=Sulfobacillus harzensis TaxID=2729629 RepID=A0A7Y0L6Q7_9FIRM|nr:6-phospho-beta-glucosidase [Sulfobacillus harzensis]NMP22944.1 6-phospho-beta-glucosidase [Sulfobacillus harzensis]